MKRPTHLSNLMIVSVTDVIIWIVATILTLGTTAAVIHMIEKM